MVNLRVRSKAHDDAGALAELLAVRCAINSHTFLTKGGDLLRAFKVQGRDHEGLDAPAMESICQQMRAAVKHLADGITLYQVQIRRSGARVPAEIYTENPVLKRATENRNALFETKSPSLFTVDVYFVLCAHGEWATNQSAAAQDPLKVLQGFFSAKSRVGDLNQTLDAALEKFDHKTNTFAALLEGSLGLKALDKAEAFSLFRRLLNFKPDKDIDLQYDEAIDYQACGSTLECYRDHLRLDDHVVQVLTLKDAPSRTFANVLSNLHSLPSNCIIVTEWRAPTAEQLRRIIRSKRRHFHNSKASLVNYVNTTPAGVHDVLVDDSAVAYSRELGQCLDEMELGANLFGEFSLTVILHDEDFKRLRHTVGSCLKIFAAHDAQLIEERYNALNAYLAAIPGNHRYNLRRIWLAATNYADLSFLFSVHNGERFNPHLKAEYLAALETTYATPYYFNLHVQDVAHTLILGSTGSVKASCFASC